MKLCDINLSGPVFFRHIVVKRCKFHQMFNLIRD